VKNFLKDKGAEFTEKNISNIEHAKEAVRISGVISVPVIHISEDDDDMGRVIIGPNLPLLASML
jgi:glutaredoxin